MANEVKSLAGNVDIKDHDGSTTGLRLGGELVTLTSSQLTADNTFINSITASATEINKLDGYTGNTDDLNTISGAATEIIEVQHKIAKITLDAATYFGGPETETTFTFPEKAVVTGCFLDVVVGHGSSATLDVGTGGTSNDPDGLLNGVSIQTAGIILPTTSHSSSGGFKYVASTRMGALLYDIDIGAAADAFNNVEPGYVNHRPTSVGGDVVTVDAGGNYSSGSAIVDLYIQYIEIT